MEEHTVTRLANRRDSNHAAIVCAYQSVGCYVMDLSRVGAGVPDLLIGLMGVNQLVEIKVKGNERPNSDTGKAQERFKRDWRGGKVRRVRSVDDALDHVAEVRQAAAHVLVKLELEKFKRQGG